MKLIVSRTLRDQVEQLSPSTLRSYVCGVLRAIYTNWSYNINVFLLIMYSKTEVGLVAVLDNKIKEL